MGASEVFWADVNAPACEAQKLVILPQAGSRKASHDRQREM